MGPTNSILVWLTEEKMDRVLKLKRQIQEDAPERAEKETTNPPI